MRRDPAPQPRPPCASGCAWHAVAPAAVACVLRAEDALLTFYAVPPRDWRRVRTTNAIERAFREVRRRTRPMTCFTNDASCDRIVYAVMHHLNSRWQERPLWKESTQTS
ncbi:MAG: transposase [bacterium]